MRYLVSLIGLLIAVSAAAQYKVTIAVQAPNYCIGTMLYLASTANQWQPNDVAYKSKVSNDGVATFTFSSNDVTLAYKITNGSWAGVETKANGADIPNRTLIIQSDTSISIKVNAFKNRIEDAALVQPTNLSTASNQIVIDSVWLPSFAQYRKLHIYLPKNYNGKKRFPVLYMFDGQNLFDKATSSYGEWQVDEYLDSTANQVIVVGIEHSGANRLKEYNPYFSNNQLLAQGKGATTAHEMAITLKRHIDKKYTTLTARQYTSIAGSSMGGLMSYYTALRYPNIYGKVGILSPSFWVNIKAIETQLKKVKTLRITRFYFYAGTAESKNLVSEVLTIANATQAKCSTCAVKIDIKADEAHNEAAWQKVLPQLMSWLR